MSTNSGVYLHTTKMYNYTISVTVIPQNKTIRIDTDKKLHKWGNKMIKSVARKKKSLWSFAQEINYVVIITVLLILKCFIIIIVLFRTLISNTRARHNIETTRIDSRHHLNIDKNILQNGGLTLCYRFATQNARSLVVIRMYRKKKVLGIRV